MTPDSALPTLLHAFESGAAPWPAPDSSVLVLNAPAELASADLPGRIVPVQGFRPSFRALSTRFPDVSPAAPADRRHDTTIVLCGRYRGQNESWIAEAAARTRGGGAILVAGLKVDGVDSLRKRAGALVPLIGHAAKHHGVTFWFERPEAPIFAEARSPRTVDGRFRTFAGMFSSDRVDAGSALLAEAVPGDISGRVADFCSGWGFLAASVAAKCPGVTAIDLFDADHASVEAARFNMTALAPRLPAEHHWIDLVAEPLEARYDAIVMNPPFHKGRAAEPILGAALIKSAAAALRKGGRLFLVANRGLPYEATLRGSFSSMGEIVRGSTFKVLWARR